jgi:aspartate carbamoyltransferase catalytic subunit
MTHHQRDFLSINDLTDAEIEEIFDLTDEYLTMLPAGEGQSEVPIRGQLGAAKGFVLATLFYEPSTRTRLSFESAMIRLGGAILGTTDPVNSSIIKGETIADTVRVIENYADLIVIRHNLNGAAHVAAEYASIPIINGGDGNHEHPTQTLCDLYTLRKELAKHQKGLRDITVLVVGDLKNGRTAHSLVYALARFGANIITMPAKGLELPESVGRKLQTEYGCLSLSKGSFAEIRAKYPFIDAIYVSSVRRVEPDMFSDGLGEKILAKDVWRRVDACYVTRLQDERLLEGEQLEGAYPVIDPDFLRGKQYKHTLVLHPLPRVGELSYDLDGDPRALYFKQMAYSVPIRMALIAKVLGIRPFSAQHETTNNSGQGVYVSKLGIHCENPRCVSGQERRYLSNKFMIVDDSHVTLRCQYCDAVAVPRCIGNIKTRTYSEISSADPTVSAGTDVVFFADEEEAQKAGFKPHSKAQTAGSG